MAYTDTLDALAASTNSDVQRLYARHLAGELTEAEFVALATAAVSKGEGTAVALSDHALAVTLTTQTGKTVLPIGLLMAAGVVLSRTAIRDALADPDVTGQLEVNARDRVLATAHDAYGRAMQAQGVQSWTRVANPGACDMCLDMVGDILPAHAQMYHHKGCGCTQTPVTTTALENHV